MKIGSIVGCIDNSKYQGNFKPDKKQRYTVKEIMKKGTIVERGSYRLLILDDSIYLEELKNKYIYEFGFEMPYFMDDFAELLPPIENIEETINLNVQELELI